MMVKGKSFPAWMKGKRERTTMGNNQHTAMIRSLTDWCWRWWWWRLRLGTVSSGLSSKEAEQLHPPRGSAGNEDRPHHLPLQAHDGKLRVGGWRETVTHDDCGSDGAVVVVTCWRRYTKLIWYDESDYRVWFPNVFRKRPSQDAMISVK